MSAREVQSNEVPAGPLQALIRKDARAMLDDRDEPKNSSGLYALADSIGINGRILSRVLTQKAVSIRLADEYCIATGRHLWEAYPELYDYEPVEPEEVYHGERACRKCGSFAFRIVGSGDGRHRLPLDCLSCGKRTAIIGPKDPAREILRRVGGLNARADVKAMLPELAARYRAGETLEAIGASVGASQSTIHLHFKRAGIERRVSWSQSLGKLQEGQALHRERQMARARARRERVWALTLEGVEVEEIARSMGMTRRAVWRDRSDHRARMRSGVAA